MVYRLVKALVQGVIGAYQSHEVRKNIFNHSGLYKTSTFS